MDLELPQRQRPGSYSFNTNPAALTAWLNDLPLMNTGRSLELLDGALQQINTVILPANNRAAALELFMTPVMCISDALKKKFLDKPLPVQDNNLVYATQTLELCNKMATGYRILADDLLGARTETTQLAIALHRALRCLSEILLTSYRIYIQYPEGLWKAINMLYALADKHRIAGQAVIDTTLQTSVSSTIENVYKQILLLSLACPYRLRQKDIHFAYNTLQDWADLSQLHHADDKNTHGLFSVNLQSDDPPCYRNLVEHGPSDPHIRILDTNNMAARMRDELAASEGSTSQQTGTDRIETLQRLMLAWGVMPKRRFARHPKDAPVEMVIGLIAINRLALGSVTEKPDVDDSIRDKHYLQDPTFEATTRITADTHAGKHPRQSAAEAGNPFKGAYAADNMAASRIESWKIADISAGGYCLLWDSDKVSCAQVGELIALVEEGHRDPDMWQLGTIRRMKFTEARGLELGVQLLSPGARAVWAQLYRKGVSKGDRIHGILLPGIEAIGQQASLLLPSLPFRSGCTARNEDNGKTETIKLTRQLENTGSFSQFHFTSL
jgi:hypothetical protein